MVNPRNEGGTAMSLSSPFLVLTAFLMITPCCICSTTIADDRQPNHSQQSKPWTLDEALGQIELYPRDAYLQYVALQLARREGEAELRRVAERIQRLTGRGWQSGGAGRREQVDLFNLTTGALAVQESLQMDAMTAEVGFADWDPQFARSRDVMFNGSTTDGNKLRQLAIAMGNYDDTHKHYPAAANYNSQGQPLLSWRVHLLPFVGHEDLYQQFRLDEPWDSPHNQELISKMPDAYKDAADAVGGQHKTRFLVPVGERTLFPVTSNR